MILFIQLLQMLKLSKTSSRVGEMTQCLRNFVALAEDSGWVPRALMVAHYCL